MKKGTELFMGESFAGQTIEQKMRTLAKIQKRIKMARKTDQLTGMMYALVCMINTLFLTTAFFALLFFRDDKLIWEELPDIVCIFWKVCDGWNGWMFSISEDINVIPVGVNYFAGVIMAMVAGPSIVILIVKTMMTVFYEPNAHCLTDRYLPECFEKTYMLAKEWRHWYKERYENRYEGGVWKYYTIVACIAYAAGYIISLSLFIWCGVLADIVDGTVDSWGKYYIMRPLAVFIILVILGAVPLIVMPLLVYFPSKIAVCEKLIVRESDLNRLEKYWAEVDPVKEAELERRKQAEFERQKELERWKKEEKEKEEQIRREAAIWAAANYRDFSYTTTSSRPTREEMDDMDLILKTMPPDLSKDM